MMAEEKKGYNFDDGDAMNTTIQFSWNSPFKMKWVNICNCIRHEMYPRIASAIISLIDDNDDLTTYPASYLFEQLETKRKLRLEERNYLIQLIQRAQSFKPITIDDSC